MQVTLFEPGSGWRGDVLVDADPETPVDRVVSVLSAVRPGHLWLAGRRLEGTGRVGDSPLRDGVVLTVDPGGTGPAGVATPGVAAPGGPVWGGSWAPDESRATAVLRTAGDDWPPAWPLPPGRSGMELAVVGGPLAGRWYPLSGDAVVIGRDVTADVTLVDPAASRHHARLRPARPGEEGAGWYLEDLGSANGTWLEGQRLDGPVPLLPGRAVEIGSSLLEIRPPVLADADVHPGEDATLAYNRPPRLQIPPAEPRVSLPHAPAKGEHQPFPWPSAIAPVVMSGVLYAITKSPETLAFAGMSPILVVSNTLSGKRRQTRKNAEAEATYGTRLASARAAVEEAAAAEAADLRLRWLDPAATAATVAAPGRRIWERREHDFDALVLRVGVADRTASVRVEGTDRSDGIGPDGEAALVAPRLTAAPVVVNLKKAGVLGVAGPPGPVRGLARWMLGQLAAWHGPRAVRIEVLTDPEAAAEWDGLRWYPHARNETPGGAPVWLGNDGPSREERVKELLKLLEARSRAAQDHQHRDTVWVPAVVVVLDGVRALRAMPGVPRLLSEGPRLGIYTIGLDVDPARLAEEGRAEVVFDPDDGVLASVRVDGEADRAGVLVDQVDHAWFDRLGRGLSPLRDAGGAEGSAIIPTAVRFVELVDVDLDRPDDVIGRWRAGGRTTSAPVGVSIDGTFSLDLKRDGPHALVAGTTGSGKSEFLQTLVASLALANRPDAVTFVLVDYKGASAFADCAELPHTVGMVTNLDGRETQRALASLDAELRRREGALHQLRAADVDAAWEADPERAARLGLARLVIVIDEFAELVHELPDFVTGLIRIARVGRSLGVHLILATQRPTGVVSGEMRANTGLRVGLRMEDAADSQEVLESAEAAGITRATPGRAFARTGGGASIVAFQSARVAGRRKGENVGLPDPQVLPLPWTRVGYPVILRPVSDDRVGVATDLHALVEVIADAAEREGIPRNPSPWLPPLPALLGLDAMADGNAGGADAGGADASGADASGADASGADGSGPDPAGSRPPAVAYGLEDRPAAQEQGPARFDLVNGSHLVVAGAARSGRSTLLRTLAASLARSVSPADLHLYGLDFGNGALLPLASLPHCGAVVLRSEGERVERLISRLSEELASRQEQLARQGFGDIAEQRAASPVGRRWPYMVVLLDRWEGFTGTYPMESGSTLPTEVARLVREGPGAGVRLVISGDRSLLTDRISTQIEDRLVLRFNDRDDYRLANINPKTVATDVEAGRALRADSGLEVQIAVLDRPGGGDGAPDPSGQAQGEAVRAIAAAASVRWPPPRANGPLRVDTMPAVVTFDEVRDLVTAGRSPVPAAPPAGSAWALIGGGGDELTAYGVDLAVTGGFVVCGAARSGRSTTLMAVAGSLLEREVAMVVVCPRAGPLATLEGRPGVTYFSGIPDPGVLTAALEAAPAPVVVMVDDADVFAHSEADDALREFVREAGPGRVATVVAAPVDDVKNELRGAMAEARRGKVGIIFSPGSAFDGDVVGTRIPKSLVTRMPAGRGCLLVDGECLLVQVPLVSDANVPTG
jgi:S-DNA-T family DNA segregation ATPase FtsK/SpoIIIE